MAVFFLISLFVAGAALFLAVRKRRAAAVADQVRDCAP